MWVSQERQDEIERSTNIRDQRCRKYNNLQFLLWTVLYEYNNIISCRFILFHILYLNINVMFNLYRRNCEKIWILNLRNYIIQFIALIRMLKIFFYYLYRCMFQSMCSLYYHALRETMFCLVGRMTNITCTMMDGFQFQFENETDTFVMTFKLEINALFAHLFTPREGKGEW